MRLKIEDASRILVLDPIHGAEVIADALKELGKEVDIFNPYREPTFRGDLDYDLVIAPVHLNPNFEIMKQVLNAHIQLINHHEAVKELVSLNNPFSGLHVIEITGTVKKTTTCELIYQLLRGMEKNIILHTSSGTRYKSADGGEIKLPRLSGTPANVLKVMLLARDMDLNPEIAIFEISLGLTGSCDVGVITSLEDDYKIAGATKTASAAKIASIKNCSDGIVVHPGLSLSSVVHDNSNSNSYGDRGENLWIEEVRAVFNKLKTIDGKIISGSLNFAPFKWRIGSDYYRSCLEAALCAVLSLGIAPEELNTREITAVAGRMKVEELKGRILIDNSNSGTKLKFVSELVDAASHLRQYPSERARGEKQKQMKQMILIIGEDSPYVCEGINVDELKEVVEMANERSDFKEIIIVGDRFRAEAEFEGVPVSFASDLDTALNNAVEATGEGDVIISSVKTWR